MALSMTIAVDDQGRVNVSGPLENQLVCYGLLEVARDAIKAHCDAAAKMAVKPATPEDVRTLSLHRQ